MTRPQATPSGIHSSIPATRRRIFYSPKHPEQLWCPPGLLLQAGALSLRVKLPGQTADCFLPLRKSSAVSPLHYTPSYHEVHNVTFTVQLNHQHQVTVLMTINSLTNHRYRYVQCSINHCAQYTSLF